MNPSRLKFLEAEFHTESLLQSAFMKSLKDRGFEFRYHTLNSFGSQSGFPDIVAVHKPAGLLWAAEMKGPKNNREPDNQTEWLDALRSVRRIQVAGFVRPADYDRVLDDIDKLLFG